MNIAFYDEKVFIEFCEWFTQDKKIARKIMSLVKDIDRHPFTGIGKPEPLRHNLAGWWSREITDEHRLVYKVQGEADNQRLVILSCKYHYDK